MILNPVNEFDSVTVSCFDVQLSDMWTELELLFMEHRMNVIGEQRPLAYEEFGPDPLRGGSGQQKGGLFTPGIADLPSTGMITNLVDGWLTLATSISKRLGCNCWRFTVCRGATFSRTAFTLLQSGSVRRTVSVQLEDQWVFFAKGELLAAESPDQYKRKRIRERLTREYVLSIARKVGFPIEENAFWERDESSVFFRAEQRPEFR